MCDKCGSGGICIDGLLDGSVALVPAWDAHIVPPYSHNEAVRKFIDLAGLPHWADGKLDVYDKLVELSRRHHSLGECSMGDGLDIENDKLYYYVICAKCRKPILGGGDGGVIGNMRAGIDRGDGVDKTVWRMPYQLKDLSPIAVGARYHDAAEAFLEMVGRTPVGNDGYRSVITKISVQLQKYVADHARNSICGNGGNLAGVVLTKTRYHLFIKCSECGYVLKTVEIG